MTSCLLHCRPFRSEKLSVLRRNEFALKGSKFSLFRVDPFSGKIEKKKQFERVASPESHT